MGYKTIWLEEDTIHLALQCTYRQNNHTERSATGVFHLHIANVLLCEHQCQLSTQLNVVVLTRRFSSLWNPSDLAVKSPRRLYVVPSWLSLIFGLRILNSQKLLESQRFYSVGFHY